MEKKTNQSGSLRPPIVTILGHVDHGKTTLLDAIRKTNVAGKEIGSITQSTLASQVVTPEGKKITFIDTPGHAVFSQMRARGAKVADLAVLVVSADDGVKPQTKEALGYIKETNTPFLVVITKIDLPQVNIEKAKGQIEKEGVSFEGKGGNTPLILVSAKSGKGINDLVEMIFLVSEVNAIAGDAEGVLEGLVIETSKDKRGPVVSVVITNGTIKVGMDVAGGDINAKVRGLFDHLGKTIKKAGPGDPVQILGFPNLPTVGEKISSQIERSSVSEKKFESGMLHKIEKGKISIVVKTNNAGTLKDLVANLPPEIVVTHSSVGDVSESDIFAAKSSSLVTNNPPRIFAFEAKIPSSVAKLAKEEGVIIERFELIYKLFERLEELILEGKEKVLGEAKILASFPYEDKLVAGSKIVKGRILKTDKLILMRKKEILGEFKIASMKKDKVNIDKALAGEEFGIIMTPQLDFKVGDVILSVTK